MMTGRTNSQFTSPLRKPFVSTVTGGESKSRGAAGNRLTSTGHGLLFEERKNKIEQVEKMRANTQMKKMPILEEDEKRKILQNAAKVNLNRTVNVDSYLANQLAKGQPKS